MIQEKQSLSGSLNAKQPLNGNLNNSVVYRKNVSSKEITSNGIYNANDDGVDGYDKVIVDTGKYAPKYISFYQNKSTDLDYEIANLDTSNITNMSYMFYGCNSLKSLDLSSFNISNVTEMASMFNGCSSLTSLDLSSFDTSNVTDMSSMFNGCSSLTSLDLSSFDTSNVTDMSSMFNGCVRLEKLPLINTSSVTKMSNMFRSLNRIMDMSNFNYDTSKVTNMNSMFYEGNLRSLGAFNCGSVTDIYSMFAYINHLENVGGFIDLGKAYLTTASTNNSYYALQFRTAENYSKLTEQSMINILNNLYDIASKGCKTQKVVFGSYNLARLTSEEGQQALENATAKGWTIS